MPKVRVIPGPYQFFFVSFDCNEPAHIHVARERMEVKFWLEPVALAWNRSFGGQKLNKIEKIIVQYHERILEAWYEHCREN